MQYVQNNNDIISVQTGEIRARVIMLNYEATRFGIIYGVIDDMSEDEIMRYADNYSGINGVFETEASAIAHAMASMQPAPTPFGISRIDGEVLEAANPTHEQDGSWIAEFSFNQFKGTCKQAQSVLNDLFSYELPEDIKDAITYITEYASRFDDNAPLIHHNFRQAAKWWFQHKFDIPQKHWALFLIQQNKK
jgi:hypothetical protein